MLPQVDSEGHYYQVLNELTDNKIYDSDITNVDGFIKYSNWNLHQRMTTLGWKLLVKWKDDSVDWVPLNDLKQYNPVELAEYGVVNEISDEPALIWWVKETLRLQDRIIYKVKYKYFFTSHKFGIQVPETVKEAYEIDRKLGTSFWTK